MTLRVFIIIVLGLLGLGGIVLVFLDYKTENAVHELEEPQSNNGSQYEDALNGMLREVASGMEIYKARRRAFTGLIEPENLKTPGYIEENAEIMTDMAAELRVLIEKIMTTFSKADRDIKALMTGGEQQVIAMAWEKVRAEQINPYIEFFAIENDVISSYQRLMSLYLNNAESLNYDSVANDIVFEDEDLKNERVVIQAEIRRLADEQSTVFGTK